MNPLTDKCREKLTILLTESRIGAVAGLLEGVPLARRREVARR